MGGVGGASGNYIAVVDGNYNAISTNLFGGSTPWGVAANPVTNRDFTRILAAALHRPAIFPMPPFALKLLFGEMSQILLASQRVAPKATESAGFKFRFPQLEVALADILGS